jgi:maleylpyruvate isomerase
MQAPEVGPSDDIVRVVDAHRRLLRVVDTIDDATVRHPSLLPGWTVGHVLTHLARNADSHVRRAEAAARGEMIDQYPGGWAGRTAEIEAGAARSAAELVSEAHTASARCEHAWAAAPPDAWNVISRDASGRERPLHELPGRRWQEVEVHLVDLGIGITWRDWPDDFVATWLPRVRRSLPNRLPAGASGFEAPALDGRDELAWLYGRLERPDLPVLTPWG